MTLNRARWSYSPDVPDGLSERIDAVVVSEADVPSIRVQVWTETFPIVVTTRGRHGARMYADGRLLDVPPVTASEVDATGAGDVWAAAFAIRMVETDDVTLAANFASAAAAMSVEHRGMRGIPTRDQGHCANEHGLLGGTQPKRESNKSSETVRVELSEYVRGELVEP